MDAAMIIQALVGALGVVLWFLYTELKKKADNQHVDFLNYKLHVAETFVTTNQLTGVIETLNRNVEAVATTALRIEGRLNQQIDNSNRASTP